MRKFTPLRKLAESEISVEFTNFGMSKGAISNFTIRIFTFFVLVVFSTRFQILAKPILVVKTDVLSSHFKKVFLAISKIKLMLTDRKVKCYLKAI